MEAKCSPHGWTLDTLEKHLSDRIEALENLTNERFVAADKALTKAEMAAEKRFESVNEFRSQLADQAGTLLPRSEHNVLYTSFADRLNAVNGIISRLDNRMTSMEAAQVSKKETVASSTGAIVAIISVIYSIAATIGVVLSLVLRH